MADAPVTRTTQGGWAAALALLAFAAANWPALQQMLDRALLLIGAVVLHPLAQAAIIGTLVGAGFAWRLPHDFPRRFEEPNTIVRLRWYCSALTFVITFALYPAPLGIGVGAMCALLGQYVLVCGVRTFYRLFPRLKPQSLKPNTTPDRAAPASGEAAGGESA